MIRKQTNEILKYLSLEDQKEFLNELLALIKAGKRKGSFDAIDKCIEEWEATAEMNSIPGFQKRVSQKVKRLNNASKLR